MFEDYKHKESLVVVYTGNGKGKTSASLGLTIRALGADWRVAYVQFIKHWEVSEHKFFAKIADLFGKSFMFYKGGKGFYNAGELSAKGVSDREHHKFAEATFKVALKAAKSGKYELVVCDEINNAVHDGLLTKDHLKQLIEERHPHTSLCITGRNFPKSFLKYADIVTDMTKVKHHFDEKYLANKGIDY